MTKAEKSGNSKWWWTYERMGTLIGASINWDEPFRRHPGISGIDEET